MARRGDGEEEDEEKEDEEQSAQLREETRDVHVLFTRQI